MKNFENKTVVITGAGSGMGRAYAIEFASLGAKLALNDFDAEGLAETTKLLKGTRMKGLHAKVFDVSDKVAMHAFADEVKVRLGGAHVVINNAGVSGVAKPVWLMDTKDYEHTFAINFLGVVHGTQAFLPHLFAHGEGAIVNVSSVFGLVGTPGASGYCATKFAVRGFTESLMVELQESPVSVHLVHPGGVRTNIAKGTQNGEAFAKKYLKTEPADVARHVIRGIRSGKQRMVCGHQSSLIWFVSWGMALERRNRLLYRKMKELMDPAQYRIARRRTL